MIPSHTITNIIHNTKIEEVVAQYVKLSRKGSLLQGLCPFHNEKTPSFTVTPSRNIYKCFGCGKGGDAANFIMEHEKIGFIEAIKILAKTQNITIDEKPLSDEDQQRLQLHNQLRDLYLFAAKFYHQNLLNLQNDKSENNPYQYLINRILPESITTWQLGFAPAEWDSFSLHALNSGYSEKLLITSNLCQKSDKTGKLFDFFRNRIIFPITDKAGRITSFAGRIFSDSGEPKYINLREGNIYHKGKLLYGLKEAVRAIRESNNVYITEGYTDVIRMHEMGFFNTVATSGTAFTTDQLSLIKQHTSKATLLRDGDKAGLKAAEKDGKLMVENKLNVYLVQLPEGKDPADAFQTHEQANDYINSHTVDFIGFIANTLIQKAGSDPMMRNDAITQISELLVHLDKTIRELYIETISKQTKIKAKIISDKLKELEYVAADPSDFSSSELLPDGVDPIAFERFGFYEYKNEYYFRTQKGHEKLSNFKMTPLFHINSINESKRIYELENCYHHKVVVDLDMQEMTSLQAFQRNIEGRGNFLFWGQINQFNRLKLMLYEETSTCQEISTLGWQKEGFYAWSNGVINNNQFTEIDEYGVVAVENEKYFIPAFSKIYIKDKSIYLDERNFRYIPRDVSLPQWSKMLIGVFGENAVIGICFWVASLFRDSVIRTTTNFPILNLFGPKGSGKSQMAMSLMALFGIMQKAYNIHNGTKPGLSEHLQQFNNAIAWIDEYKNNIEREKIETIKGIYDSLGRTRMSLKKGIKKESTTVSSGVILSGQEMTTVDVALFSRVIYLRFMNTSFTAEEEKRYEQLKEIEKTGLSCLSVELLNQREHFEQNYYTVFNDTLNDFKNLLSDNPVEGRIARNMITIVAAWRTIAQKIEFPFSYSELQTIAINSVKEQNSQISKSNEIGQFWDIFEAMFDENIIKDQWQFRIDYTDEIKTKRTILQFTSPKNVLKFKYNTIYSNYAQHARKQGITPLPSDTLQYYLKNQSSFIGIQDQCVFTETIMDPATKLISKKTQNTSAMCFDYDALDRNLIRTEEQPNLPNIDTYTPF